jgi:hypothetical protein
MRVPSQSKTTAEGAGAVHNVEYFRPTMSPRIACVAGDQGKGVVGKARPDAPGRGQDHSYGVRTS